MESDRGHPARFTSAGVAAATAAAMVAFAANSVLCRLALGHATIDAASFTTVRLVSGALTLLALASTLHRGREIAPRGGWPAAGALFGYAIAFSFAYLSLSAGTGALILFGAVQLTMILAALRAGERPGALQWLGFACAVVGLVYLVAPGVTAPSPLGALLMAFAGACWGVYSLLGRGSANPMLDTTANFLRAAPLAVVASAIAFAHMHVSSTGLLLATASGAVSSGLGYVIWYAALRGLTATRAAIVQLVVPLLAALGGVIFLGEEFTARLAIAGVLILGGVALAIAARRT
jgi:drug/metabolite transporter (DMT)-like permease